jgi:hypothetical protein
MMENGKMINSLGTGSFITKRVVPLRTPFDYRDWSDVEEYWVKYEGHFYQDNKEGQGKALFGEW